MGMFSEVFGVVGDAVALVRREWFGHERDVRLTC